MSPNRTTPTPGAGPGRPRTANLFTAVNQLDADDIKRHIAAGESIDQRYALDDKGAYGTLLYLFAIAEQTEQVNLLLKLGANPNAQDQDGETALHLAADRGDAVLAKALIAARANPNLKENGHGMTPLHMAAARGHTELVRLLIASGADRQARSSVGATPLMMASNKGQRAAAFLLAAPLDVEDALRRDIQGARHRT